MQDSNKEMDTLLEKEIENHYSFELSPLHPRSIYSRQKKKFKFKNAKKIF